MLKYNKYMPKGFFVNFWRFIVFGAITRNEYMTKPIEAAIIM